MNQKIKRYNIIRTPVNIQPVFRLVDLFSESIEYERSWKLPFNALCLCAAENLESTGKNLIGKRIKGAVSSEYRRTRDLFLSMIHAYFAQISFLFSGMPHEYLPNPELLSEPFKTDDLKKIDEKRILRCLGYAEDLLRAMRTNADDQLAIRAFCLKTVLK